MRGADFTWLRPALLILAALAAAPAAASGDTPFFFLDKGLLTNSRVLYPLQVGEWTSFGEWRAPEQVGGVAVRYVKGDRSLDLHFLPVGFLGDEALTSWAEARRSRVEREAREAGRAVKVEYERIPLPVPGSGEDDRSAWAFGYMHPGEGQAAATVMFVHNMYIVEARIGPVPSSVPPLMADVRAFVESAVKQLHIVSTGGCWLPARTHVVDELPARDDPAVMATIATEGERAAVLAERGLLVSRDEEDRAEEIALHFMEKNFPGCVAPEQIEPEVPPTSREIRIEYRARQVDDLRGPPVGQPRAPRRGTG